MQLSEVGAPILFLFSFSISIRIGQNRKDLCRGRRYGNVENSMITHLYIAFPQERIYNKLWLVIANYNFDSWRQLWEY